MFFRFLILIFFITFNFLLAENLKEVSLRLQWKHQFEFAGFYAAKELGYYKDLGIDVNILEYENGIDLIQEVNSKKIDFGVWGSGVIQQALKGKNIIFLANYFKRAPLAIVTQPEIKFPTDLENKKLMIPKSDFNSANYIQMFKTTKVDTSKIQMVEPTFNMDDFINKKVDAVSIFLSNEPFILNKKNIAYNILDPSSYGVVLYDVNLFTSKDTLNKDPKLVESFVEASNKGWSYAIKNPEIIVDLILRKYNTQNKSREHLLFEAKETIKMIQPDVYDIGGIDIKQIDRISRIFKDLGMINSTEKLNSIIYSPSKIFDSQLKLSNDELKFLKSKKALNVCINNDILPVGKMYENGFYEGISKDLIDTISNKIGIDVKYIKTNNNTELLNLIKSNDCDLTSVMKIRYDIKDYISFTNPLFLSSYVIVSKNTNRIFIENLDNYLDKKFIVKNDKDLINRLKKRYPKIKLEIADDFYDATKKVLNENVFAFIDDSLFVSYNLQNSDNFELSIIGKLKYINSIYSIGVNSNVSIMNRILENAINTLSKNEIDNIKNKWKPILINNRTDLNNVFKFLFMLILVVLAVIYWNYRLNLQVKKQVDEIRKKDNLIMEQARFYSIGQTVGNIAHQWKAPLTYIGTIATTMEVTLKHKGKDQYLEISENSLEKISKYVQQLKFTLDDFLNYYTTKPIKADFYVYETIEENVLNLLRNKVILKNVSITYNFDKEYKINSYEHILANIFMVLFNNSLDIFKQDTDNQITVSIYENNQNIVIEYKDNAGGIKVEPVQKVFDYFVTTKDNEGHGLGLTTLKMLVEERLNGSVDVKNIKNGAVFEIRFPKC